MKATVAMKPATSPIPAEMIEIDDDTETVGCDGGGGALGHPMVYYNFGTLTQLDCGYCGRRFVKRGAGTAH